MNADLKRGYSQIYFFNFVRLREILRVPLWLNTFERSSGKTIDGFNCCSIKKEGVPAFETPSS
jgi:hypothetical protein